MRDFNPNVLRWIFPALLPAAVVFLFLLWQGGYLTPPPPPVLEETKFTVPEHHIPPEYFKDAKPATPLSEPAMVTIVISEQMSERFSPADQPGILVIPVAYLDFANNFINTTLMPTWHEEKSLQPEEPVAMIRMPADMYDRLVADANGTTLDLPASVFMRRFDNLSRLHALITPDGRLVDPMVTGNGTLRPSEMPALPSTPRTPPTIIVTTPRID
jgi:hypothetical protein